MAGNVLRRASELFLEVAERPPEKRREWLEEACGDDTQLRAEVESLLEHDSLAGGGFLRPPGRPAEDQPGPDALLGQTLAGYRIERVIASGGMGTVYAAVQDRPRRTVALKVMRQHVTSAAALQRFEFEAEILGRLRHPNIAQIHKAGMHDSGSGRMPFFAMEYVPSAQAITAHANGERLNTRRRLELFAKVCDAVHHGHQRGIIHRDLKPANILVDSAGQPKVIDFGVARATDSDIALTTVQTGAGQLIGTLQYMSPEQCAADPHEIDTRSDVYSLGVVLYELLTGALPYDVSDTTIVRAARMICESPPVEPSLIDRRLRGDVEMIVLKSLQKDREQRYPSSAELAADIRRFLNREPIKARPATAWTRLAHWIVRRPAMATSAVCAAVAVLTVLTTLAAVWVVNARPYAVKQIKDPNFVNKPGWCNARLVARSGNILKSWPSRSPTGIGVAKLVKRPAELGGGSVVVLGGEALEDPPLGRTLCVFDANGDLEDPIWEERVQTEEILPSLRENRGYTGDDFTFRLAGVLDVFPDKPGDEADEIVAVFGHRSRSQGVIRIYDLAGTLLYQVWYDGVLGHCRWLQNAKQLVFVGDWHGDCYDDGGRLKGEQLRDFVVFALRPKAGTIHDGCLDPAADPTSDNPLAPAWFLLLRPALIEDRVLGYSLDLPRHLESGRGVNFSVFFDNVRSAGMGWDIDEFGETVPESWVPNDGYQRNQQLPLDHPDRLPDPSEIKLVPYGE